MTTETIRLAIIVPRRTLRDRILGDRCPYCGERDRRPATHISAGRCFDRLDALDDAINALIRLGLDTPERERALVEAFR